MLLGKRQAAGEKIRLLVTDVDGVLTDGAIIYDEQGGEIKRFNVQDGAAARLWLALERPLAVISSRQCPAVSRRMEGLGIGIVHQGVRDKAEVLRDIMRQVEAGAEQVCFIGDDLADAAAMADVGLAVAPADAAPVIRQRAAWVTRAGGGTGVLREVVDELLRIQGRLDEARARLAASAPRAGDARTNATS